MRRIAGLATVLAATAAALVTSAAPASATCYIEPHVHPKPAGEEQIVEFHVYCGPPPAAG